MSQPPKVKPAKPEQEPQSSIADDQRERGYYYDDAHGYQRFDPEADDENEDKEEGD